MTALLALSGLAAAGAWVAVAIAVRILRRVRALAEAAACEAARAAMRERVVLSVLRSHPELHGEEITAVAIRIADWVLSDRTTGAPPRGYSMPPSKDD